MPGPVSDSYDPVWGTGSNAAEVRDGIRAVREKLATFINAPPDYILDVIRRREPTGPVPLVPLTVRECRILRFTCGVALDEEDM